MTRTDFDCFIVVRNPKSTNARNTERRIAEIRASAPDAEVIVVETSPKGYNANKQLLRGYANKLGKRTLVCIAAGDGTINSVIEGLLSDPALPDAARHTPILPLWCGNANDLAHMLNGKSYRARIATLLERGQIVKVYPLSCTLETAGKTATRHAACYTSFGASAYTTQALGRAIRQQTLFHRWPLGRLMHEFGIVISAMRKAPVFRAAQNNRELTIFECIFFNGPRFAKVMGVRRHLTDKNFHMAIVERKRFSDVMISIFKLRRNSVALTATQAQFTALDSTWAQFDGEAVEIPAGTTVHLSVARRPFYALATKQ